MPRLNPPLEIEQPKAAVKKTAALRLFPLRFLRDDTKDTPRVCPGVCPEQCDHASGHTMRVTRSCSVHPNPERYGGQRIFVVRREDYVYLVPFVEDEHTAFLKTIIPSRKATKEYLGEESHED